MPKPARAIVAIARLETVATGDMLTSERPQGLLDRVRPRAEPVFAAAIRPKDRIDEAKISQMLARIVDEDPSLRLRRADVTTNFCCWAAANSTSRSPSSGWRANTKSKSKRRRRRSRIIETITAGTEMHSRYKHQTGGHGQFGDVWLRFEPRPRGSGVTFEEKIVGGVVPRQFIPAVEKGVREALLHGPSGHPVTDCTSRCSTAHTTTSIRANSRSRPPPAWAFARRCQSATRSCSSRSSTCRVVVPTTYTSTVIQQLTGKRGQILGMNPAAKPGSDVVEAYVPQVELARYITELRTATQGLGTYSWRHERYDPVPGNRVAPKAAV